jgi:ABC-2 type transport system permease protein
MSAHTPTVHGGGFARRLSALIRKEVHQLLRDRSNLVIGVVLPIVLIFIFGFGMSLDVKHAPVGVVLEDPSPEAADVVAGLQLSTAIQVVVVRSMHDGEALLHERRVDALVRIPPEFAAELNRGEPRVQLIVHGADTARANLIRAYATGALNQWSLRQSDRRGGPHANDTAAVVRVEQRIWFNESNTSTWYLVPGLIVLVMTLVGAFLTALVMAREWERGTLEALFVTPVRPLEILLAKIIPYFAVGMTGLALCLVASRFLFGVPMRGSLALILLAAVLYLLVAVGLGLLISAATKNQFLASQVALLATFLPSLMLSGFIFDLRNAPSVVRFIGHLLPATHFMELIRTLLLAGNVWSVVWRDSAILALYAVVLLGMSVALTRKRLAT